MNRIARILLAAVITSALFVRSLPAAEQGQRYVILKQRSGAAPDVAALGGTHLRFCCASSTANPRTGVK